LPALKKRNFEPSLIQTKKNILWIWFNRACLILIPLITTPLIVNHFGLEVTAIWLLAVQLSSFMMLLDVGITNSLVRLLSMRKAVESSIYASSIFTTTFYILLLIGGLIVMSSNFLSTSYANLFDIPHYLLQESKNVILLAIVSVGLIIPLRTGYGIFASKHLFDRIQRIDTIGNFIKLLLIFVIFNYASPTLVSLGYIVFGSSVGISLVLFISAIRQKGIGYQILYSKHFSKSILRLLFSMSFAALLVTFSSIVLHQGTSSLVGYLIDLHSVSLLALPIMIFISITPFFQTFATIASPIAAGVSTDEDRRKLFSSYIWATKYLMCVSYLAIISFFYLGEFLIGLWLLGPKTNIDEIRIINSVVTLLFCGYTLGLPSSIGRSILASVGWHWSSSFSELSSTLAGVLVGIFLVYFTDLKIIGMVLGIVLAMTVKGVFVYPKLLSNYFGSSYFYIMLKIVIIPVIVFIPHIIIGLIFDRFYIPVENFYTGSFELFFIWLVTVLLYFMSAWFILIEKNHKLIIKSYLSEKLNKLIQLYK